MFKSALCVLVLCIVLQDFVSLNDAYDNHDYIGKIEEVHDGKADISSPKDELKYSDSENYKKKYSKEDKYNKEYTYKKIKGYKKKRFVNANEFEDFPKYDKFSKHGNWQNHYENPHITKEINYHDKVYHEEKQGYHTSQEIIEEPTMISLHHDIDVNFIGPHEPLISDAEIINLETHTDGNKKENYIKSDDDMSQNKAKTNFYKNLKEIDLTSIPPSNNSALVARYIIHNVDWTAIATISTNSKMRGNPFVNVISVSDGPLNKGTGVPFFYMTPQDFSSIDLEKDNRCTVTASLAQTNFCKDRNLDPESPLCARLILNGKIKKVKPNTEEEKFAKEALFSRHPEMESWPASHNWFFSKLKIKQIILINHFGGASYISIQDYFDADNE